MSGPGASRAPLRLGAADVGSNATRVRIEEVGAAGRVPLEHARVPVRLGSGAFSGGRLHAAAVAGVAAALARFRERLEALGVERVRAVATSAVRESANAAELVAAVREASGLTLEVIGGEEEAQLVWAAVGERVPLGGRWLLADLGGGSLELSSAVDGRREWSASHPVGTVRLLEGAGPARRGDPDALAALVRRQLAALPLPQRDAGPTGLIATGGNMDALARLSGVPRGPAGVRRVSVDALATLVARLAALEPEGRVRELGLRPDRADVILPAALVYLGLARRIGAGELVAPAVGLIDGVLLELARGA